MKVGIIGLGVMGRNLALNARDGGCQVVATDSWEAARDWAAPGIEVVSDHTALASALPAPRIVLLMVKAGNQVDVEIAGLVPHLAAGGHCQTKNLAIFQSPNGCWKSQVFCAVHRKPGITNST